MSHHRNNGRMQRDDDESTVSKIFKGLLVGAAVVGVGALLGYTLYKLTEEELNKIPVQHAGRQGMPIPNEECSICLDPFKRDQPIKQLPCKHIYHDECIQQWVKTNSSCPLCRKRV